MRCVTCSSELQPQQHEGVAVQRCPDGHGLWLHQGELLAIVDRVDEPRSAAERLEAIEAGVPASAPDHDAAPERLCPVCGTTLGKVNYDETSGIMIDTCVEHGVWLDEGELERIEAWIEANQEELEPIRRRLREELAENEAELDAAERAGRGKGPLGVFFSMWHYLRHSPSSDKDTFGADRPGQK